MTYISTIPEDAATGEIARIYEKDLADDGYVWNVSRAFSLRPAVYRGWEELNRAIKSTMDLRRYELATLAAARRLKSSYCALAHGKLLATRFMEPSVVRDLALGLTVDTLDDTDRALMEVGDKVVTDATSVTQADIDRLRRLGLTDGEIFEVVVAAAARCFFSKTLDALGVEPDRAYLELDPELREALTVGRRIEGS